MQWFRSSLLAPAGRSSRPTASRRRSARALLLGLAALAPAVSVSAQPVVKTDVEIEVRYVNVLSSLGSLEPRPGEETCPTDAALADAVPTLEEFEREVRHHPKYDRGGLLLGDLYLRLKCLKGAVESCLDGSGLANDERARLRDALRRAEEKADPEAACEPELIAPPPLGDYRRIEMGGRPVPAVRRDQTRLSGRLGAGVGHDTNPNLLAGSGLDPNVMANDEADNFVALDGRLAYQPFLNSINRLAVVFDGAHTAHRDLDSLDLTRARIAVSAFGGSDERGYLTGSLGYVHTAVGSDRWSILVQLGLSHYLLDHSSYLTAEEAAVSVKLREGDRTSTQFDYHFESVDYHLGPVGSNRDTIYFGVSQWLNLSPDRVDRYLRLGIRFGDRTANPAFAALILVAEAELFLPLRPGWALQAFASRWEEDFDDVLSNPVVGGTDARRDVNSQLSARLLWDFRRGLQASARLSWSERDSNIDDPFDYDRVVAALELGWYF